MESFSIWALIASWISLRPWPTLTVHRLAKASMYSLPSESHTSAPSARSMTTGLRPCICVNGGQRCCSRNSSFTPPAVTSCA